MLRALTATAALLGNMSEDLTPSPQAHEPQPWEPKGWAGSVVGEATTGLGNQKSSHSRKGCGSPMVDFQAAQGRDGP